MIPFSSGIQDRILEVLTALLLGIVWPEKGTSAKDYPVHGIEVHQMWNFGPSLQHRWFLRMVHSKVGSRFAGSRFADSKT